MSSLSPRDRELVALGAALGSNCVPCVEYHVPESRRAGLTDEEIRTAIQLADKVRQVPARNTLEAALGRLSSAPAGEANVGAGPRGGCGAEGREADAGAAAAEQPAETVFEMMSRMMAAHCGPTSARTSKTPEEKADACGPTSARTSKAPEEKADACGPTSAGTSKAAEEKAGVAPAAGEGCGCAAQGV